MASDVGRDTWKLQARAATTDLRSPPVDPSEALARAVAVAVQAPSGHNTQSWQFAIRGERCEVRGDRSRRLTVVDPDDRELIISCGAALAYLRLAIENTGFGTEVGILPSDADDDLIAVVTVSPPTGTAETHVDDLEAIAARRTNRNPYEDRPLPDGLLAKMQDQAVADIVDRRRRPHL
jgi:hypothetical protein